LEFERAFPDTTVVVLDQNYRSTQTILDAANAVIANNLARKPKKLWTSQGVGEKVVRFVAEDEHDEAAWLATEATELHRSHAYRWGDMAVFYRTNAQSRAIEEELVRVNVPYKVVGGARFYERREVKDMLAYLRAIDNSGDEVSLKRVLNVPRRGIGETSIARLDAFAAAQSIPFGDALERAKEAGVTGKALSGIAVFLRLMAGLRALAAGTVDDAAEPAPPASAATDGPVSRAADGSLFSGFEEPQAPRPAGPGELLQAVIDRTDYFQELQAESATRVEIEGRIENVEELLGAARQVTTLSEFLTEVSLVADTDDMAEDGSSMTLMTLHTAKGLEFPVVFMVGMEEGVFPHLRALGEPTELEEERRLCYVGVTRARERLYMSYAWCRSLWGEAQYNRLSRFVEEIPEHLVRTVGRDRRGRRRQPREEFRTALVESAMRRGQAGQPVHGTGAERLGLGPGQRVVHGKYGEGIVLEVAGQGADAEATIHFPDVGEKRFSLHLTPLKRA
jgi:DNA helicase-2/ATP-dependent DNA helicase PcrA